MSKAELIQFSDFAGQIAKGDKCWSRSQRNGFVHNIKVAGSEMTFDVHMPALGIAPTSIENDYTFFRIETGDVVQLMAQKNGVDTLIITPQIHGDGY